MKIVITTATYYPKTDGVQQVTQYQAEGLAKKGHEVIVITSEEEGLKEYEIYNNVEIYRINAHNFYYWHKGNKKEFQKAKDRAERFIRHNKRGNRRKGYNNNNNRTHNSCLHCRLPHDESPNNTDRSSKLPGQMNSCLL